LGLNQSAKSAVVAMVIANLSSAGCSFIFSESPPPNHRQMTYFKCASNIAPPIVDAAWAGVNGLAAAGALVDPKTERRGATIGVGLTWLAVSGAAALYGFHKVGECRSATRELMARMAPPQDPEDWPPPPYGLPRYPPPPPNGQGASPGPPSYPPPPPYAPLPYPPAPSKPGGGAPRIPKI
jgi:hypothetical protein